MALKVSYCLHFARQAAKTSHAESSIITHSQLDVGFSLLYDKPAAAELSVAAKTDECVLEDG